MIEREIVNRQIKEHQIQEFIEANLSGAGFSKSVVKRTPLGEKIIIYSSRPGMVVGRSGKNIKDITEQLRTHFSLENPQIEIAEVPSPTLDANIVAERIATSLERFGPMKFKSIIHRAVEDTMAGGAKGIEVLLSGKVPSQRARTWRVSQGYLKKCGEPALENVDVSYKVARLKSGIVGIVVKVMPPDVVLPDSIRIVIPTQTEEVAEPAPKAVEPEKKPAEPKLKKPAKEKPVKEKPAKEKAAKEKQVKEKPAKDKPADEKPAKEATKEEKK